MTLKRWLVVLASTGFLIACTDSTDPAAVNRLNASWAGRGWAGNLSALVLKTANPTDILYLRADGPAGPRAWWREDSYFSPPGANVISAEIAFNGVGTYILRPNNARFQEWVGGDVITATYSIPVNTTGMLVITSYDPDRFIEGILSFDAVSSDPRRSFGDRAGLENGRFRARVYSGYPVD